MRRASRPEGLTAGRTHREGFPLRRGGFPLHREGFPACPAPPKAEPYRVVDAAMSIFEK
jgi:hypothetical protein